MTTARPVISALPLHDGEKVMDLLLAAVFAPPASVWAARQAAGTARSPGAVRLSATQLDGTDASLDASSALENSASILTLSLASPLSFSALLRGPTSLGTLYAGLGFPAIPSSSDPRPSGTDYFNGGDNTRRHSCSSSASPLGGITGGMICGVQIEANFAGVRDNAANRERFADVTAQVLEQYLRVHWGLLLAP